MGMEAESRPWALRALGHPRRAGGRGPETEGAEGSRRARGPEGNPDNSRSRGSRGRAHTTQSRPRRTAVALTHGQGGICRGAEKQQWGGETTNANPCPTRNPRPQEKLSSPSVRGSRRGSSSIYKLPQTQERKRNGCGTLPGEGKEGICFWCQQGYETPGFLKFR